MDGLRPMADRTTKTGEAFVDIVPVLDFDQVSRVSGQEESDFSVRIYHEGEEVTGDISLTITEIGDSGNYAFAIADGFPSVGYYVIDVQVLYNDAFWRIDVEVHVHDIDSIFYVLSGGYGVEEVTLTLVDTNQDDAPIVDALVNVMSTDGETFITFGRTDPAGRVTFSLDVGSYTLRMYSPGFAFDVETLTVPIGGTQDTVNGVSISVEAPTNPALCRLYAYFYDMAGAPVAGFRVKVVNLYDAGNMSITDSEETFTTDADGLVTMDLVHGIKVKVSLIGTKFTRTITVPPPPTATANLLMLAGQNTDTFRVVRAS